MSDKISIKGCFLFLLSIIVVSFYLYRPIRYSQGDKYLAYKHFDEMLYMAKITQIACGNSPEGNCVLNHKFDKNRSPYPIYTERFFASIYSFFSLNNKNFIILINILCPLLILWGLFLLIKNLSLDEGYNFYPVLLGAMLVKGSTYLKPYFPHIPGELYIFPFERFLNPLFNIIPSVFFFSFLASILKETRNRYSFVFAGIFCGLTFYTSAYYYLVTAIILIIYFLTSFFLWKGKTKELLAAGLIAIFVGSPVIYGVLFGPQLDGAVEKMQTMGLLLPIKNPDYLLHKGMLLIMLVSTVFTFIKSKYRKSFIFVLIFQVLIYALSNLSVVFDRIFYTYHLQYLNVISFTVFYLLMMNIITNKISQNKSTARYSKLLPVLLSVLIIFKTSHVLLKDSEKVNSGELERRYDLVKLLGKGYQKKIFLAPLVYSTLIAAENQVQLYGDRYLNFCDLSPEMLLEKNVLVLKAYAQDNFYFKTGCATYWPWVGFNTDEFGKINTSCRAYEEYISKKVNDFDYVRYAEVLRRDDSSIEYIIEDNSNHINKEFVEKLFLTNVEKKSKFWTVYKVKGQK